MFGVLIEHLRGGGLGGDGVFRPHLYHLCGETLRGAIAAWRAADAGRDPSLWERWRRDNAHHFRQGIRYYGSAASALSHYLSVAIAQPAAGEPAPGYDFWAQR